MDAKRRNAGRKVGTEHLPQCMEKETAREGKNEATGTELPHVDGRREGYNSDIRTVPPLRGAYPEA